jgi:translocation and assembly module TamA
MTSVWRREFSAVAWLLALAVGASPARAADPQSYRVEIASVGNGEVEAALKSTSDLQALRKAAPVGPFGLIARARSDVDRLTTALESFGYYQSHVEVRINGLLVSNPGLGETLTALPKGSDARVTIGITLGPLYHLRAIDVDAELPDAVRTTLGLNAGDPAIASAVLAGGARLLTALQERGYAFAKVDPPVAYEAADAPALDLKFHVETGARVNIGEIRIQGLQRVHESLLRARLLLHTGDAYSPSAIERARNDLLKLGVFGQVSVEVGTAPDDSGGVPITFKIRERLRHAVTFNAAFSSDLGGSGGATWSDRNVFGNAEQLNLKADVINLGGSDTTGVGYDTKATYTIPDVGRRDQSLQFTVGAIKQSLQAYDQTARTSSATLNRRFSAEWSGGVGIATTDEHVIQDAVTRNYTLVALPLTIAFDSTHLISPLDDPSHGIRASMSVAPTVAIGHPNATFIISQIKAATYFDLSKFVGADPGRTVLATRALAGLAQGAGEFSLPPDQRFYGGGSGTIRGYRYQGVGPVFTVPVTTMIVDGKPVTVGGNPVIVDGEPIPIGGTAITAGSLELRQRFGANYGAAVFLDAGQVSATLKGVPGETRIGAGAGVRYFTPIGPIRLDFAVPTPRHTGDDAFEVYIGLGQSF